jgi:GTP-binding protein LepA
VVIPPRCQDTEPERTYWILDRAIRIPENTTVILRNCRIKLSDRCRDHFFRSANCGFGFPDPQRISEAREPIVKASIITPTEYVGSVMQFCLDRRGTYIDMKYLDTTRAELIYEMPLNEIVYDFFDTLKSKTKGYASLDYEPIGYRKSELVKLDILLNGELIDALSFIVHADRAYTRGRKIVEKLRDNIPRQLFELPVQAAIGGKVIARETVRAMRKDVLAKCYGGDITRKKKLLEKQKEGKKRMRSFGSVQVPSEAFMAVLKMDDES